LDSVSAADTGQRGRSGMRGGGEGADC